MNIYVSNLSKQVTENELKSAFEEFGAVSSCRIIVDRFSGENRGFGFVEMDNDAEANTAIEKLDGLNLSGQEINVKVAEPRKERPSGGGGFRSNNYGGGNGGNRGGGYGSGNRRY